MSLIPVFDLVSAAKKNHYAIGHFNINGLDWITTYLKTAQETKTPIVLATSDRIVEELGALYILVRQLMR